MISATEAKELFAQPAYTIEEIETQIRRKALEQDFTCFCRARISDEQLDQLRALGFSVESGTDTWIVRW
jgi:hypothetical protein